jgi:hypothetical protein
VTAGQRVTMAREFLDGARKRKVAEMPPSVLMRECAELRRLLGQVLDVISEAVTLTGADLTTMITALEDAADYRRSRADAGGIALRDRYAALVVRLDLARDEQQ